MGRATDFKFVKSQQGTIALKLVKCTALLLCEIYLPTKVILISLVVSEICLGQEHAEGWTKWRLYALPLGSKTIELIKLLKQKNPTILEGIL